MELHSRENPGSFYVFATISLQTRATKNIRRAFADINII